MKGSCDSVRRSDGEAVLPGIFGQLIFGKKPGSCGGVACEEVVGKMKMEGKLKAKVEELKALSVKRT